MPFAVYSVLVFRCLNCDQQVSGAQVPSIASFVGGLSEFKYMRRSWVRQQFMEIIFVAITTALLFRTKILPFFVEWFAFKQGTARTLLADVNQSRKNLFGHYQWNYDIH